MQPWSPVPNRSWLEPLQESFDFGNVVRGQAVALRKVRDQWSHAPSKNAVEQPTRFTRDEIVACDRRAIEVAPTFFLVAQGAFCEQPRQQGLDRPHAPVAGCVDA